ncbi:coproporphyrinogen III oxidase [Bacteroidia bacterium]|nr:coproporphyrinogen III oxidase [Bacteroidia bacterium]
MYCDFFSGIEQEQKEAYLEAVLKEMEMRRTYLQGETIETIYFGGGTPSQLAASDLGRIFEAVYRLFEVIPDAEITLEANPDDMSPEYIASLRSLPVNRISMGVQSFDDEDLHFLGRRHNSKQVKQAIACCKENGYTNISIDLIYGIPGQTTLCWEKNLEEAVRMDVQHLSAYHLTYEKGTPLHNLMEKELVQAVDEDASVEMFNLLMDYLANAGYEHYEISNFAKPGWVSRHNSSYWLGKKYLGIGPSAHSYDSQNREWNISSLPKYMKGILDASPFVEREAAGGYNEYVMTGLRTRWGINLPFLSTKFGSEAYHYCLKQAERFLQTGLLYREGDILTLTRKGLFVSDSVISTLFKVDSYTK